MRQVSARLLCGRRWSTRRCASGAAVLVARPTAAETASSYAALDDLVHPVAELLPRVPEVPRRALAAALLLEPASRPPEPRAVAAGLLAVLGELAPAVVPIDDWQWLDEASASVLAYAVRRLPEAVRMLATVRTGVADEAVVALVRQLGEGRVVQLVVGPLDGDALRRIVADRVGTTLSPPALARLEESARGNPLTAIELARAEHGPVDATDVRRLLAARVAALSEPARDVLRAAAALSAPTDELATKKLLDSLPVIGGARGVGEPIPGTPPDPADAPEGCAFRTRCPYAADACLEPPPLREVVPGQIAACHFAPWERW